MKLGKITKKLTKGLLWLLGVLVVLAVSLFFLLQTYGFQTWIAQRVAGWLSDETKAKVEIRSVSVDFFNKLVLQDVFIQDLHGDTLLFARKITVNINEFSSEDKVLDLKDASLEYAHIGLANYKSDSAMNFQFLVDAFASTDTTTNPDTSSWKISYGDLALKHVSFSYRNEKDTSTTKGINFSDIYLSELNARIADITSVADTFSVRLKDLSCYEKCGLRINQLSSNISVSPSKLKFDGMMLALNKSLIATDLVLKYNSYDDFNDFLHKIKIRADLDETRLHVGDLGYFVPSLLGFDRSLSFSGRVSGTISNIKGKNMTIDFGDDTHLAGDFEMNGLPNLDETYIMLDMEELTTSKKDIERIPLAPYDKGKTIQLSANAGMLGKVKFQGRISGYYYDLVSDGSFQTALGTIVTNLKLRQDPESGAISYRGTLRTAGFQMGRMLFMEKEFGAISMDLTVDGTGIRLTDINADIKGKIHNLYFNNYDYKNLDVNGRLARRVFSGSLIVADENLDLAFNGSVNFSESPTKLVFDAKINKADLKQLHYLEMEPGIRLATDVEINMTGDNLDNLKGYVKLKNIAYTQGKVPYDLRDLLFVANEENGIRSLKLNSEIVDAQITGKYRVQDLGGSFFDILSLYVTSLLPQDYMKKKAKEKVKIREEFEYSFVFKNTTPITRLFIPDLTLAFHTIFKGKYNSKRGYFDIHGSSKSIRYAGTELKAWKLDVKTGDEALEISSYCDTWKITDTVRAENFSLHTRIYNDTIGLVLNWKNRTKKINSGDIRLSMDLLQFPKIGAKFLPTDSTMVIEDSLWKILDGNMITFDSGRFDIQNLVFAHAKQEVKVHGKVSERDADQLLVEFKDFNLANINALTYKSGIGFKGTITGSSTLSSLYVPSNLKFNSGFDFNKLWLNKEEIGTGTVITLYDKNKNVIALSGSFSKYNNNEKNFSFSGKYFPGKEKDNIDMDVDITNFGLQFFEPFLKSVFSKFRGYASGRVSVKGEVDNPKVKGYAVVQVKNLQMDYLNPNNSYTFSDSIYLEPGEDGGPGSLRFDSLIVSDFYGKTATITGRVYHTNYKDWQLDLDIWANKFMAMNTTEAQNSLYYGRAFITGRINVFGYVDQNIQVDASIKTDKSLNPRNKKIEYTQFFIPLSGPSEVSESTFITFINKDSLNRKKVSQKVDLSGLILNLDLEMTPDAECQILFDPKVGDIIKAKGEGNMRIEITSSGNFNIYGDYNLTEGEYLFTLQNIINKKFRVEKGSSLKWTGDPYNAEIDLKAIYEVRTSLQVMFPDDSSGVYKRRYPAHVVLNMTRGLLTPDIAFDVDLPSVDASVLQTVKGYLNTEMEMNRQVFSLLVLNTFVTPQSLVGFSDVNSNANVASVTGFEMLSNQLSNILSQVSTEFDLRVNYRPGDDISSDQLEVALSKHLFNDRLVIDGSVANNGATSQAQSANAIVGEVNVEYKVTDDGKIRIKAFNKANDNTVVNTNDPYTQGVGVFYREDFETLKDLFKRYLQRTKKDTPATQSP